MSRTLKQIELGSTVWVREGSVDVDYILTRKDINGVELLRKRAYTSRRMNSPNTTVYDGCELDQWLINTDTGFLSLFSETLRSNLVHRSISTFTYGDSDYHYISRNCYLYSYGDMFLTAPSSLYAEVNIVPALIINKGTIDADSARVCRNNADTSAVNYWLRSAYSATNFWHVYSNSGAPNNNNATSSNGIRPVLNVSPDTIVSDEGTDIIYLLPEEKPRKVEYIGKIGVASTRPTIGCVKVDTSNLTNTVIKVTNNHGDAAPVWQTVQNGVQFEFTNTEKQTANWELGIWFYGETPNLLTGYSEQPQLLFV